MTEHPDIVILGSGPAGSSTAVFLAERLPHVARNAVILERRRHPRPKGCGGGLTGRTAPLLQRMGLSANPTDALEAREVRLSHGQRITHLMLSEPIPVARRWELDRVLARRAREGIGDLREDEPARSIRRDGDHLEVITDRAVYRTRLVIDASGARCVSRRSGLLPMGGKPVPVWVAEGPPGPDEALSFTEPALEFDFSEMANGCAGYYWAFPCHEGGARFVSRGFYPAAGLSPAAGREALMRQLAAHGVDPASVHPVAYPARLFEEDTVCAAPGLLAVGDAAGVDPVLGEGISQSLEYGWHTARFVDRAWRRDRLDFSGSPHLPRLGLGGRLRYMARMHDEFYVPQYQRRMAFALDCGLLHKIIYADSHARLPSPLLWSAAGAVAVLYRHFADLELETPRDKTVQL